MRRKRLLSGLIWINCRWAQSEFLRAILQYPVRAKVCPGQDFSAIWKYQPLIHDALSHFHLSHTQNWVLAMEMHSSPLKNHLFISYLSCRVSVLSRCQESTFLQSSSYSLMSPFLTPVRTSWNERDKCLTLSLRLFSRLLFFRVKRVITSQGRKSQISKVRGIMTY